MSLCMLILLGGTLSIVAGNVAGLVTFKILGWL